MEQGGLQGLPTKPLLNRVNDYPLAKAHTDEALNTLLDVARNGRTDAARVSAANAILDRGCGKPAPREEESVTDLPPVVIQVVRPSEE